jgi:hypothetical protein
MWDVGKTQLELRRLCVESKKVKNLWWNIEQAKYKFQI